MRHPVIVRILGLLYLRLELMIIISEDLYFRQAIDILLTEMVMDYSGVVCVDGGQVIAFFHLSVIEEGVESFFRNCFLVVDKRSQPEKIRQLLAQTFYPTFTFSFREMRIFTLLAEGKSYAFISSVFALSFGATCYIRNKILSRYGFRNLNIFLVVMFRLRNGLAGKLCPISVRTPLPAYPARGGLHA